MAAYYNEIEPFAVEWLRNLIKAGLIADGEIDTRSIIDVRAEDLAGFTQCHFFAGIGGWSYALRLSGWPDDRPVWTGSCPCQPFSVAGKGKGTADVRHLWPDFHRLISERRPAVVFGEQVASKAGRDWLSGVLADLEGVGYAGAGADLCAAGVGAPHIRQRLYWVALADAASQQKHEEQQRPAADEGGWRSNGAGRCGMDNRQGDVGDAARINQWRDRARDAGEDGAGEAGRSGVRDGDMADTDDARREGRQLLSERANELSPWSRGVEWRRGADEKERRVKSGVRLLVDGVPHRVGRLRGYGNAIVPQVAAQFIMAFTESQGF